MHKNSTAVSTVSPAKESSAFYPVTVRGRVLANVARYDWAAEMCECVLNAVQPWMALSDDALWELMFGCTIDRAWMVWSNGYCPACKESVPMYEWAMDAFAAPWKARCPCCGELFPKNDFTAFYRSGLDMHGVFDPARADRTLLFNAEHPDPADPLHLFGVDDGDGYVADGHRWRFIGAYLIYAQWKQAVVGGIRLLAAAYMLTGDPVYAHKAGILLDRVADLYPTFDFKEQGSLYEHAAEAGYVSTWHDACEETRIMAQGYDQVFEAIREDRELVAFLSRKAQECRLANPKASFADIQRNIEGRILRDAIENRHKIRSNYPRTEIAVVTCMIALDWPHNRDAVFAVLDEAMEKATAVDGVTGEKGLSGYTCYTISSLATFLERLSRVDETLLPELLARHPKLRHTYRFHIDTWFEEMYYPRIGDCSWFGGKTERYCGAPFQKMAAQGKQQDFPRKIDTLDTIPGESIFSFMWRLYTLTGDPAYVQLLYHENDGCVDGLPFDFFDADPKAFQDLVAGVIAQHGTALPANSINKQEWHLAMLRSGRGAQARCLWVDYDNGGYHSHLDAMNLGLFGKGLDLMPDFGYPPVQYGGWASERSQWYMQPSAHNTVVIDGRTVKGNWFPHTTDGATTLWADGQAFRAVRVSGASLYDVQQYERTAVLVDLDAEDSYVFDVFRVVGGTDHVRFQHSSFGEITTQGLSLPAEGKPGDSAVMRNFRTDAAPAPGWSIEWKLEDRYHYLEAGRDIRLRYTDLTQDATVTLAEGWITCGHYNSTEEAWIHRVLVRRQSEDDALASTFIAVAEPFEGTSKISAIHRLPLETVEGMPYPEAHVAVEVRLADGRHDLVISADRENPLAALPSLADNRILEQPEWGVRLEGELCFMRRDAAGKLERVALAHGKSLTIGDFRLTLQGKVEYLELLFTGDTVTVVAGDPSQVASLTQGGHAIQYS